MTLHLLTPAEAAHISGRELDMVGMTTDESTDRRRWADVICGDCGPRRSSRRFNETGGWHCPSCDGFAQPLQRKPETVFEDYLE